MELESYFDFLPDNDIWRRKTPMELENYFNFLTPYDIRLQGSRIGIETILWQYLYHKQTAEQIAELYPSLTKEQVYATLTYYWHNKEQVDAYLQHIKETMEERRREQELNPSPVARRLGAIWREQHEREQQLVEAQAES
jgi:uncharacterized protein (DUF433 family)